jgi:hypothetical protein
MCYLYLQMRRMAIIRWLFLIMVFWILGVSEVKAARNLGNMCNFLMDSNYPSTTFGTTYNFSYAKKNQADTFSVEMNDYYGPGFLGDDAVERVYYNDGVNGWRTGSAYYYGSDYYPSDWITVGGGSVSYTDDRRKCVGAYVHFKPDSNNEDWFCTGTIDPVVNVAPAGDVAGFEGSHTAIYGSSYQTGAIRASNGMNVVGMLYTRNSLVCSPDQFMGSYRINPYLDLNDSATCHWDGGTRVIQGSFRDQGFGGVSSFTMSYYWANVTPTPPPTAEMTLTLSGLRVFTYAPGFQTDCNPPPQPIGNTPTPGAPRIVRGLIKNEEGVVQPGGEVSSWVKIGGSSGATNGKSSTTNFPPDYRWSMDQSGEDVTDLRIYKTVNPLGTTDSTKPPVIPGDAAAAGANVWDANTIDWQNPPEGTYGDFVFYVKGNFTSPTPTPTFTPVCHNLGFGCDTGETFQTVYDYISLKGDTSTYPDTPYWYETSFTAPYKGTVDGFSVYVDNYRNGGFSADLECKMTDIGGTLLGGTTVVKNVATLGKCLWDGTKYVSDPSYPCQGTCYLNGGCFIWQKFDYSPNTISVEKDQDYKIKCRDKTGYWDGAGWHFWWANKTHTATEPDIPNYTVCICPYVPHPPAYSSLVLKNSSGLTVPAETGNRNQICDQRYFGIEGSNDRRVWFTVTSDDEDGGDEIDQFELSFDDYLSVGVSGLSVGETAVTITGTGSSQVSLFSVVSSSVNPGNTSRTLNIPLQFNSNFTGNIYSLKVNTLDNNGNSTGIIDSGRDLKIWDCKVPVTGTLYDGSSEILCSSGAGFGSPADASVNFVSLGYTGVGVALDRIMTVSSPTYNSDGSNSLVWGADYWPEFNDDAKFGNWTARVLGAGVSASCPGGQISLTSNSVVDPYNTSVGVTIDFSIVVNQSPWYQVMGAGIKAKTNIVDQIPSTVNSSIRSISVGSSVSGVGESDNGIVAAVSVNAGAGVYGIPLNMSLNQDLISENDSYSYEDIFDKYYRKNAQGRLIGTGTSLSQIGAGETGVVFVNGNLTIDVGNSLPQDKFLMILASGDITVNANVDRISGIFFAQGNIIFDKGSGSDNQLVVEGSLYANGLVRMLRDLNMVLGVSPNNTTPAVLVKYRPDFVVNMPARLTQILAGWREGL